MNAQHEKEIRQCRNVYLKFFVIDGKPASEVLTDGQVEIFHSIVYRPKNRVQIICPTQYGKSLTIALACLIVSCVEGKVVVVTSPTNDKAKIIMRYYIDHLGDNPLFFSELEKDTKLERLRMEESKERIVLKNGGGIFTLSANVSSGVRAIESAMGQGAEIVINDENALIPDQVEATIFRMIAGKADAFYCKVGNPFYRNHFHRSWLDPKYQKIFIDYLQGIKEGRYTQEFIDEAKKKPHFSVLFECKFPDETEIDMHGFTRLLTDDEIQQAQSMVEPFGEQRLGVDVAEGGGNYNVLVTRWRNFAKTIIKYQTLDTMDVAAKVASFGKHVQILDQNIFIDAVGVGKGVLDRLVESRWKVTEVKGSEQADDYTQFANKRAEMFWRVREWIKGGGKLEPDEGWNQLQQIKYKTDMKGRLLIISKEDMMKEGFESPDQADALSLTFARKSVLNTLPKAEREIVRQFDANKNKKRGLGSRYTFS